MGLAGLCRNRGAMHEPAYVCHLPFPTSIRIRLGSHMSETVLVHSLLPETKNAPEKELSGSSRGSATTTNNSGESLLTNSSLECRLSRQGRVRNRFRGQKQPCVPSSTPTTTTVKAALPKYSDVRLDSITQSRLSPCRVHGASIQR